MDKSEEHFYAIAGDEIANKTPHKACYAKAVEEAMGNIDRIASLYIKIRVQYLKEELQRSLLRKEQENAEIVRQKQEAERLKRDEKRASPRIVFLYILMWIIILYLILMITH